ncbi:TPA: phage portal protein, partial [Staphylococcus aureus]|nr:phage portal protein [Staphylococcus aureus]HDF1251396.1 phage portal protein [Staphylococcus aureus]
MTLYTVGSVTEKFSPIANDDFIVNDLDELFQDDFLRNLISRHKTEQLPRLEMLEAYYLNRNTDILTGQRRLNSNGDKADHRA